MHLFIGDESGYKPFLDYSFWAPASYDVDGQAAGVLGVIGPTRMAYQQVIPVVDATLGSQRGASSPALEKGGPKPLATLLSPYRCLAVGVAPRAFPGAFTHSKERTSDHDERGRGPGAATAATAGRGHRRRPTKMSPEAAGDGVAGEGGS